MADHGGGRADDRRSPRCCHLAAAVHKHRATADQHAFWHLVRRSALARHDIACHIGVEDTVTGCAFADGTTGADPDSWRR